MQPVKARQVTLGSAHQITPTVLMCWLVPEARLSPAQLSSSSSLLLP